MQARWPRTLGEIVNGEPNEESSPMAIVNCEWRDCAKKLKVKGEWTATANTMAVPACARFTACRMYYAMAP